MMSKLSSIARTVLATLCVFAGAAAVAAEYNMPVGVTDVSREIQELHMTIFWICVAIGVLVFGAMLVSMVLHRKSDRKSVV